MFTVKKIVQAGVLMALLSGCGGSPYDTPTAILVEGGKRGFGMTGNIKYTSSEEEARQEISERMREACRGQIRFASLTMEPFRNFVGVPFVRYHAVAECL